ncbi:hypothetical protein LTR78_000335 [Recurvomyces mirabilis]|uniref:Uncharacterized protein n=1 Tax=Recurvomyces mirabilis TaxID=574656 RepID=A0AAE0WXU1_9PEZI|nr:hypothetical protein LTR78_000335 [Recurvomyces mirabilis]KAK5161990.1 hypothetical protein LTS14_000336 [Recurvomyces mirabilis]
MGANASCLSSPVFGYDMVVATTQASINSTLLEWLSESNQLARYVWFTKDPKSKTGQSMHQGHVSPLLMLAGGINPFDIPDQTPPTDPRIVALTQAGFLGAIKMQLGVPSQVLPKDVTILSIVQNLSTAWTVWTQPDDVPWTVGSTVGLTTQALDPTLNVPYFNNGRSKTRAAILASLGKNKDPFTLQQLVFDFSNAVPTLTNPVFLPEGSFASQMINQGFISSYVAIISQLGSPPVSIKAISPTTVNSSALAITSLAWEVSPPLGLGPSAPGFQDATTLNYLCAVNGHQLPPAKPFSWTWVLPEDIDNESGIIAINRNLIANFILQQILPQAIPCCVKCSFSTTAHWQGGASYYWTLSSNQQPEIATVTPNGPNVIQIKFQPNYDGHLESSGAVSVGLQILPTYTCDVTFDKNIITITQHMAFRVYVRYDSSSDTCMVVDKTITDEYTISVDQQGSLQTKRKSLPPVDKSESPHNNVILNWFTNINDMVNDIKKTVAPLAATQLKPIEFDRLQSFIFPGARVFTFKSATFSANQDLLCEITYVVPASVAAASGLKNDSKTTPKMPVNPKQLPGPSGQPQVAPGFPIPSQSQAASGLPVPNGTDSGAAKGSSANAGTGPVPPSDGTAPSNGTSSGTANLGSYSLTYSSELIQNYVHGELVSPQAKFEALQTADGHSLLFAVSTAGVLNVIVESSGTSQTGWSCIDLSTAIIQKQFSGATVRTFDAGQSALDGTIGLAMSVSSAGSDHLVVCLSNSNTNTSWIALPNWISCPFDAPNESRTSISIVGVLFSETISKQQYLIVDIDRALDSAVKEITRYYVNPAKPGGTCWVRHDVPVDIQSGNYQSLTGRKVGALVDGVYTAGKSGASAQLVYVPIINAFGNGPPAPTRLSLPGGVAVSAMTVARNETPGSSMHGLTDLYAIGGSTLYYFDSEAQRNDGGVAKPVTTNAILSGTSQLFAMTHDGVTTLWGRNGSGVVYYTTSSTTKISVPGSWSSLKPVLSGIEKISPYINRTDGGNTIFAAGGGKLQRLIQATATASKMWQAQPITLAAEPMQPSLAFKSYTTSLQLQGPDSAPARGLSVTLSAKSRAPVYINGLYYTLGPRAINVPTDNNGLMIIVEAITKVHGTIITVTVDGATPVLINPMEKTFKKLAALNTRDALNAATIPQGTKAGGVVGGAQSKPFVSPGVSKDDVGVAASSMSTLNQAYDGLNTVKVTSQKMVQSKLAIPTKSLMSTSSIEIGPGDLLQMAAAGVEGAFDKAIQIFHDAATDAWTFVANIAGQAYYAILDSVETVVGAVEWVFNKIKTIIDDILLFLELLLSWDDIRRTKDVMCGMTKLYMRDAVSSLTELQTLFDGKVADLESQINSWSGIKQWPSLGSSGTKPIGSSSSGGLQNLTTTGHMFIGHLNDNAGSMSTQFGTAMTAAQGILRDLAKAVEQEGEVFQAVGQQIQTLASEITTMSAEDVLKRIIGIVTDGVLSSVQVVVDCLLKVLSELSSAIVDFLDTPVHIPVISDILNALDVSDLSILDLFCWIAAIVTTLAYKIVEGGSAPFPNDTVPNKISSATDWTSLSSALIAPSVQSLKVSTHLTVNRVVVRASPNDMKPPPEDPHPEASKWFKVGHGFAGCFQVVKTILQPLESVNPKPPKGLSVANISANVLEATSAFLGNHFGLREPEAPWLLWMSRMTTLVTVTATIGLSGPVMGVISNIEDSRPLSSKVNALLTIPALVCSAAHLQELEHAEPGYNIIPSALEEASNIVDYVDRWMYANIVEPATPAEVRAVSLFVLCWANSTRSFIQLFEGFSSTV